MLKIYIKLMTLFIFNRTKRKEKRLELYSNHYNKKFRRLCCYIGKNFIVRDKCKLTKNTSIGDYVGMNRVVVQGNANISIGSHCEFGQDILIISNNHNYDKGTLLPYDETYIEKDIEIGDFVWIGSRVMILPGTKIGEGAIIQGGAVVHGEIPPYAIAGGNPAKVFKYRDIEHFKRLKKEGKFLGE